MRADILTSVLKKLQGMWAVDHFRRRGQPDPVRAAQRCCSLKYRRPTFPGCWPWNGSATTIHSFPSTAIFPGSAARRNSGGFPCSKCCCPCPGATPRARIGFVQYYIDASPIAAELAAIDRSINRQTFVTLGLGAVLIAAIMLAAYVGLNRAQRVIGRTHGAAHPRPTSSSRSAAKASALGQITSHLIHGLQGPVAGLRAVVTGRAADNVNAARRTGRPPANYTERMQGG